MKKENQVELPTFSLGDKIKVDSILKRVVKYSEPNEYGINKRLKVWKNVPLKESKTAIIIGIRNLSNGYTDHDREAGDIYNPTEYFKALLVVSSLSNVPYFVEYPKRK